MSKLRKHDFFHMTITPAIKAFLLRIVWSPAYLRQRRRRWRAGSPTVESEAWHVICHLWTSPLSFRSNNLVTWFYTQAHTHFNKYTDYCICSVYRTLLWISSGTHHGAISINGSLFDTFIHELFTIFFDFGTSWSSFLYFISSCLTGKAPAPPSPWCHFGCLIFLPDSPFIHLWCLSKGIWLLFFWIHFRVSYTLNTQSRIRVNQRYRALPSH